MTRTERAKRGVTQAIQHRIAPLFDQGALITVIVRTPNPADDDILVTNDDIDEVRATLARVEEEA